MGPAKQAQWRAFLRKSRLDGDASLQDVVSALDEFLMPMVEGILRRRTIPSSGTRRPVESVAARLELGECVPRWPARARIGVMENALPGTLDHELIIQEAGECRAKA